MTFEAAFRLIMKPSYFTLEVVKVSEKRTGARFLAETFKGYGVTHVFFVEAILRKTLIELETLGIRRILTHSEKAAAYMADGYARVTKRPGICMAQSVGAANLASGLQDPYLGSSPVIAFTGKKLPLWQNRNSYQEIDHSPLFAPVTKYNVTVETVEQLPLYVRQAFREATSGRPRPVHLDVAGGYMGAAIESAEGNFEMIVEEKFTHMPAFRPEPEADAVRKAVELLQTAERPVIVAGGGARSSGAGPEIVELAERLSIPLATSLDGKDAIPDTHPLNIGIVGSYSRWCANRLVSEADLVLYVGSGTGDQVTNDWTIPRIGTAVIQIDIDSSELGRSYSNKVSLLGDAKVTLQRMLGLVTKKRDNEKWTARARQLLSDWQKEMEPFCSSAATPIRTERLCREISDAFPADGILVSDTGFASIWTGSLVNFSRPGQSYIRAAGSLGWAFPAAIGAKCGAPERPVVCFIGDGGFFYHLPELETASRCGINVVTVINNNQYLRQCVDGINQAYGDRPGNRDEQCKFSKTDFAKIAENMGCVGIRVEKPEDIGGAFKKALSLNRPVVVDVVTDPACRAPGPWTPPVKS
jgi:acetolactate synthase I/II/III large subunit